METVAVIVPTCNRANLIKESLDSVLNQTFLPSRVVVVNDGSTDGTLDVLAGYGSRIQVVSQENSGKAAAISAALSYITEDYIWVFDDDDIAVEDAIQRHIDVFRSSPAIDFTYGSYIGFRMLGTGGKKVIARVDVPELGQRELFHRLLSWTFIAQQGVIVKSRVFREVGYRSQFRRSQDYDFILRLSRHHMGKAVFGGPTFWFRTHEGTRGFGQFSHSVDEAEAIWQRYNQLIFRDLIHSLDLRELLPVEIPPQQSLPTGLRRRALFHRMALALKAQMTEQSLEDLRAAIQCDQQPMTPEERQEVQSTLYHSLVCLSLARTPTVLKRIRQLAVGSLGRQVRVSIGYALLSVMPRIYRERRRLQDLWILANAIRLVLGIFVLPQLIRYVAGRTATKT